MPTIVGLAATHQLPAIGPGQFSSAGMLMSYGILPPESVRRTTFYVDRNVKGAKPGDLPIEQPLTFELSVNLTIAKALGLTMPPEIMVQATRVIQ